MTLKPQTSRRPTPSEWEAWAKVDPLFGVLHWRGKGRDQPTAWTHDEFYATGALDWADFVHHWEHYGVRKGCCLEIGCGVGRLTVQLTRCFPDVHAVDVSATMLELARRTLQDQPVSLYLTNGVDLPMPDRSVDAVFSSLVFMHFDRPLEAKQCFQEIARVLREDGTILIELPFYALPAFASLFRLAYALRISLRHWQNRWRRWQLRRGRGRPLMRGIAYEAKWLKQTLIPMGFADMEFRKFTQTSSGQAVGILLARKRSASAAPDAG